jgi:hypothetical protein
MTRNLIILLCIKLFAKSNSRSIQTLGAGNMLIRINAYILFKVLGNN